jgi:hypothetical protein
MLFVKFVTAPLPRNDERENHPQLRKERRADLGTPPATGLLLVTWSQAHNTK